DREPAAVERFALHQSDRHVDCAPCEATRELMPIAPHTERRRRCGRQRSDRDFPERDGTSRTGSLSNSPPSGGRNRKPARLTSFAQCLILSTSLPKLTTFSARREATTVPC